ncbi:hypothetical protein BDZ91DRAFT_737892 [Kalaharituber pfeilii]|nr:hypothetical protein BDZ91DRAFT_737892 [Kalaharituber pfeilii]
MSISSSFRFRWVSSLCSISFPPRSTSISFFSVSAAFGVSIAFAQERRCRVLLVPANPIGIPGPSLPFSFSFSFPLF